ncbi:hypothetical protein [Maribacter cobaltidurans]|uniref:hypothetical protein n=1 Tax=Maribacter cobaltidurans TaxID=1178778 RepID=UPI00131593C1|nr:hypothetical protein [Maribacter cobaltidurans]GGD81980.1 hypothetical protein GCM10011412_19720 [Maribacter cobaltidurans]
MRHLVKVVLVVLVFGSFMTSCTKTSQTEDDKAYEMATEGDDESPEEKKEDPDH